MAKKALVIDVEPCLCDLLGLFLRRYGFEVTVAHDGLTGLDRIANERPDLVVMDVLLPRLQGHELCWRMKQDPELESIPVILMTPVYEGHAYREQAYQAGADAFLHKPIEPRVFVEKLARLAGPLPRPDKSGKPLHHELWDIRQRYEKDLPHKIAQLETNWMTCVGEANRGSLHKLHIAVHSIVGTAGSVGLRDIASRAKDFELHVIRSSSRQAPFSQQEAHHGMALLQGLKEKLPGFYSSEPPQADRTSEPPRSVRPSQPERSSLSPIPRSESLIPSSTPRAYPIVIVEHEAGTAQLLARTVTQFGFSPKVFPSASGVHDIVASGEDIRAIIVDMTVPMHRGGGIELVDSLRKQFSSLPPVVFLANKDDWSTRSQAARAGGEAYLSKPIDLERLIDTLTALVCWSEPGPFRVLVLADIARFADHVATVLRSHGMLAQGVAAPAHLLDAIAMLMPDVIVLDLRKDQQVALEVFQVIRQHHVYAHIPIIILSLDPSIQMQLRMEGCGLADFTDRGKGTEVLAMMVQQRARRTRIAQVLSARDALTGLLNPSRVMEELRKGIARAARECQEVCYAHADLDFLGKINEEHGVAVGDQVLKSFGSLLTSRLRRTDIVGRLGGDGFGIILPNTRTWAAACVLDEVRTAFGAQRFQGVSAFSASVSMGIAEFPRCEDVGSLHEAVEKALFSAKEQGRSRIEVISC